MCLRTKVGGGWKTTIADRFLLSISDAFLLRGVVGDCAWCASVLRLVGVGMRLVGIVGPIGKVKSKR